MTSQQCYTPSRAASSPRARRTQWGSLAILLAVLGTTPVASAEIMIQPVPLDLAAKFAIVSKTGVTTTGNTAIGGAIGVSPIAGSAITGFNMTLESSRRFSTSSQVLGKIFAANYASPTPTMLTKVIGDMQIAYTNAAGRVNPNFVNFAAGNIGGRVLRPGLYKWSTDVIIPANVAIAGSQDAVWIFQVAGTMSIASGKRMILSGGAQSKNIFWQVAGGTVFGTNSQVSGNILSKTSIVMQTGARLNGRALAQTAVTLDANALTRPPL